MLGQPKKNRNIKGLQISQAAVKPGLSPAPGSTNATSTTTGGASTLGSKSDPNGTLTRTRSRTTDLSQPAAGGSNPSLSSSSTLSSPSFPSSARDSLPSPTSSSGHGAGAHAAHAAAVGGGWVDESAYGPGGSDASSHGRKDSTSQFPSALSKQLASLELGVEFKLDLRPEDLSILHEVGSGNGGTVSRAVHIPTGAIMARKVVHIDAKPAVRKQILRELQIMHDCHSEYIVSFYGAFLSDGGVCMCMQFMDFSLDNVYKRNGPIPVDVLGKIAWAVVSGLTYLYEVHRIMHRDVKPSNILVNAQGEIKICDFGVSGELINSILNTFVGTSVYMSPERIRGSPYTARSDVWSFGITLIEIALGRFPFASDADDDEEADAAGADDCPSVSVVDTGTAHPPGHRSSSSRALIDIDADAGEEPTLSPAHPSRKEAALKEAEAVKKKRKEERARRREEKAEKKAEKKDKKRKEKADGGVSLDGGGGAQMSIFELLQYVVNEPAPTLPERFPKEVRSFVAKCLEKDEEKRPTPKELLDLEWLQKAHAQQVDVETWARSLK